ncbi:acyltransferase family protein [Desulfovibrio caledoniensis]
MEQTSTSLTHYKYIDGLRGWAILFVVFLHVSFGIASIKSLSAYLPALKVDIALGGTARLIADHTAYGVQLFFIVSALSLTISASRGGLESLGRYAARRFFRIAPMFYVGILLYLFLYGFSPRLAAPGGISFEDVAATVFFIHSWFENAFNSVVPGGWSIGNEAMFYVIFPFAYLLMVKNLKVFLLFFLGTLLYAQYIFVHSVAQGTWDAYRYFNFLNQLPVFMIGLLVGRTLLQEKKPALYDRFPVFPIFIAMVVLLPFLKIDHWLEPHLVFSLAIAVFIVLLARNGSVFFENRIITYIGKISFSVYLLHFAVLSTSYDIASHFIPGKGILFLGTYYLIVLFFTLILASITYHCIELPFMNYAKRIRSRRCPAGSPQLPTRIGDGPAHPFGTHRALSTIRNLKRAVFRQP